MPGVGEVELVVGLLDDPDDVGTVVEGGHERGGVPAAEEVGDPFEVVQFELVGQEHHQMIGQGPAHLVQLLASRSPWPGRYRLRGPEGTGYGTGPPTSSPAVTRGDTVGAGGAPGVLKVHHRTHRQ